MKAIVIPVALVVLLLLAGLALAADGLEVTRQVIGSGSTTVQSGGFALQGIIGQAVVASGLSAPFGVDSGYWPSGLAVRYRTYLPIVIRDVD